jgi:hypothetical protein
MNDKNLVEIAKQILEGRQVDEARGDATDDGFYAAISGRFEGLGLSEDDFDGIYEFAMEELMDLMYSYEEAATILDGRTGRHVVEELEVDFVPVLKTAIATVFRSGSMRKKFKFMIGR